jgi:hypothetical protein
MSNLNVFVAGSIHQGSERFYSDISRGRQCSFMSFSALLFAETLPIQQWTASKRRSDSSFLLREIDFYISMLLKVDPSLTQRRCPWTTRPVRCDGPLTQTLCKFILDKQTIRFNAVACKLQLLLKDEQS